MAAMPTSVNVDEPPLRELNNELRVLVEMFPTIQPQVFREMLLNTSSESRLGMVTENLLRDPGRCVSGRVKPPDDAPSRSLLRTEERFRSLSYKTAVIEALSQEFKGLNRSAIRGVVAECNHSYSQSRERLLELSTKSWRFSITRFLFRRKTPVAGEHPLVMWDSCQAGSVSLLQPTLRFTPSTELNLELWNTLIQPILNKQRAEQCLHDRLYALKVNEDQAERLGETYDCECCFASYPMEQLSNCTDKGHYICYSCIRHTINEALYGQGWAKSIDHDRCTVKCIAPDSRGDDGCSGFIPSTMTQIALETDDDAQDHWTKLQDRFAVEALRKSHLPLVRCPFCTYAELDDFDARKVRWKWPSSLSTYLAGIVCVFASLSAIPGLQYLVYLFMAIALLCLSAFTLQDVRGQAGAWLAVSLSRITRKKRGLKFSCQSPRCGRASCVNCHKVWADVHICYESAKLALRAAIEAATTEVVKRTCPMCSLSFVKAAGCNKLACVCGYTMCYVCRQEIGKESYTHFCQHFRQRPGESCTECDRCDLYKVEDEDAMVREAALRAEKEWWQREEQSARNEIDAGEQAASREEQVKALEDTALPLTSSGSLHASMRGLGSRARWERFLDRVLADFIA